MRNGGESLVAVGITLAVLVIIALIATSTALYQVDQREYALQTRFGKVMAIRTEPGLYPKAPFIDSIQSIDRRTLRADIPPREVPDQDKERLIIDTVIRYQITDPLAFRIALRNEATARERLQNIIYSAMRDTIAQHDRTEIIGAQARLDQEGKPINNDEGLPIYDSLLDTRDAIAAEIQRRVHEAVTSQSYGITILSAEIKRADFPPQVRGTIIDRLSSERQRVAARHRADGEEEYRKRTATVQAGRRHPDRRGASGRPGNPGRGRRGGHQDRAGDPGKGPGVLHVPAHPGILRALHPARHAAHPDRGG